MIQAPVIGLLNNMPDAALSATEIQFRVLLQKVMPGAAPRLVPLALPGLQRSGLAAEWVRARYRDAAELDQLGLDGLIVTGMEPRGAVLDADPCWPALARVIDTARRRRLPTVFSCLGAHAAVLHLSGIARRRRLDKLSGLMPVTRAATAHGYAAGLPASWITPHSRWHGLDEGELCRAGYHILSRAGEEVDAFASGVAPFLFLQGHPEYDRSALMHEYTRDARRFLTGEANIYPNLPRHYFDAPAEAALREVRQAALGGGDHDALLASLGQIMRRTVPALHSRPRDASVFGNWLAAVPVRAAPRQAALA